MANYMVTQRFVNVPKAATLSEDLGVIFEQHTDPPPLWQNLPFGKSTHVRVC